MLDTNELRSIATDDLPNMAFEREPYLIIVGDAADEIDANRARIAELEAENARLRGVIGFIPSGAECCDAHGICSKLLDECDLFKCQVGVVDMDKCPACITAFPNGNKDKEDGDE